MHRVRERPTVYLHIGAPKTGTTYLQNILFRNRAALRRDGLLYPGDAVRSHFWAAQDLRRMAFHGYAEPQVDGAWRRLIEDIRRFGGNSVLDHELLAGASADQIDEALADLDFADVRIVFTARDLARQLPAAWQERVKNRDTMAYGTFLERVRDSRASDGPRRLFWPLHDVPTILARWSRNLPPDRVHLVTLPPAGGNPALLWQRFTGVLGIDPGRYDTAVARENTSLSAAEAAVLRALNEAIAETDIPWPVYRLAIKHGLSAALGGGTRKGAARIELPEDAYAWVTVWSRDAVAELSAAGYSVVGELAELIPA
ncbi:MAG: hypothetical protein QOH89_1427, partial [Pseudonocardiales bacterium]|nr:hypothetical protein [Pseudonocardiales bacterium]